MEQKGKDQIKQQSDGNQQRAHDQGGHQGGAGHAGQHSGGMGGNEAGFRQSARQGQRSEGPGNPGDDLIGRDEPAEVQQSAQREGMGHHRHSSRANEQAIDAASDIDDLGSHSSAAGKSCS